MDGDFEAVRAFLNLGQANAALRIRVTRSLEAEAGVGLTEIELMRRLAVAPGQRLRMGDIADQLYVAQSGVTRVVDRLVGQGWVVREQPTDDRRTIHARLTEEGQAVVARALPVYARTVMEQFGDGLSADDLADLRRVLRLVLERLGAWDDERCDPAEARVTARAGS